MNRFPNGKTFRFNRNFSDAPPSKIKERLEKYEERFRQTRNAAERLILGARIASCQERLGDYDW